MIDMYSCNYISVTILFPESKYSEVVLKLNMSRVTELFHACGPRIAFLRSMSNSSSSARIFLD
jgi:hypothetical protein